VEPLRTLPEPGQLIGGHFRILRLIGMGRMTAVFEANHIATDIRYALKWLRVGADETVGRARFQRMFKIADRMPHPNIASIYDLVEDSGSPYLVTSFLRGQTLTAALERGTWTRLQRVDVVVQCLEALAAAHGCGVIHCELKSSNIMLRDTHDDVPLARLFDFGVARPPGAALTASGEVLGNPPYMAPEQFNGAPLDERVDVYAMGVVSYECLTGRLPFQGSTSAELSRAIMTGKFPRPRELDADIPATLELVVLRALACDPNERFQSAHEMAEQLLPWADPSRSEPTAGPAIG
jgi:serine/threonine-protein kinase